MGDYADMILEGIMCEQCGTFLGEGDDYPTLCKSCADENNHKDRKEVKRQTKKAATKSNR